MLFEYIKVGMVLNQDIFDNHGNLMLESGSVLTESYLARLRQLGLRQLRVLDPYATSLKPQPIIPNQLRNELTLCFQALSQMHWNQAQSVKLRYLYLRIIDSSVKEIIAHLETQLPDIINIPIRQQTEDEIGHAINVCLLSTVTGLYLKFPANVLAELATGALLHDIGKTALPEAACSDTAYAHTSYGYDLLLANKLSPTIALIAAQHHERPDGAGYPMGLLGKDIHPLSRIVSIANYYDHAVELSKHTLYSRQQILEGMMSGGNVAFDLNMLRAFFQTIAVYPVGSLVKLNNGRLAYIIKNKARLPLRPCVEIADSSRLKIDLAQQPNLAIEQLIQE